MDKLDDIIKQIDQARQPPVHLWQPEHHGEIDIRIDANGNWFHEGSPILRHELVQLFASILWCEDGKYFLVTPVERLRITVADVPYLINSTEKVEGRWLAQTNTGEQVIVAEDHPVELRQYADQWVPYLRIRYQLWARLNRTSYMYWVNEALGDSDEPQEGDGELCLVSGDYSFAVARLS